MSASRFFSSQFKDIRQEKLRRKRKYARRTEARLRFSRPRY
jgi:hypothetical protein